MTLSYSALGLKPFMCSCRISIFFSLSQPEGLEGGRRRREVRRRKGERRGEGGEGEVREEKEYKSEPDEIRGNRHWRNPQSNVGRLSLPASSSNTNNMKAYKHMYRHVHACTGMYMD